MAILKPHKPCAGICQNPTCIKRLKDGDLYYEVIDGKQILYVCAKCHLSGKYERIGNVPEVWSDDEST